MELFTQDYGFLQMAIITQVTTKETLIVTQYILFYSSKRHIPDSIQNLKLHHSSYVQGNLLQSILESIPKNHHTIKLL